MLMKSAGESTLASFFLGLSFFHQTGDFLSLSKEALKYLGVFYLFFFFFKLFMYSVSMNCLLFKTLRCY